MPACMPIHPEGYAAAVLTCAFLGLLLVKMIAFKYNTEQRQLPTCRFEVVRAPQHRQRFIAELRGGPEGWRSAETAAIIDRDHIALIGASQVSQAGAGGARCSGSQLNYQRNIIYAFEDDLLMVRGPGSILACRKFDHDAVPCFILACKCGCLIARLNACTDLGRRTRFFLPTAMTGSRTWVRAWWRATRLALGKRRRRLHRKKIAPQCRRLQRPQLLCTLLQICGVMSTARSVEVTRVSMLVAPPARPRPAVSVGGACCAGLCSGTFRMVTGWFSSERRRTR